MCNFLSAVLFKNEVYIAPIYNQSHSALLRKLKVKDNNMLRTKFVKIELLPYEGNILSDVDKWRYVVDQDNTPEWYDENKDEYEDRVRSEARRWLKRNIFEICGQPCTKLKEENGNTYYHTCKPLFTSVFGDTNNYAESEVRKRLLEHDFTQNLIKKYGDSIIPATMDLTSLDGLKDYGKITDIIGIPDIDLYRECRSHIFVGDDLWWLSTPDSTPSGYDSSRVRCVNDCGLVDFHGCYWGRDVRPFFILPSSISTSLK